MRIIEGDDRQGRGHRRQKTRAASAANGRGPARGANGDALLVRYRRSPSRRVRDQLIERYRESVEGMAHALAVRLPPCVDVQDLVHAGVWGLLQAIESFRPERCPSFTGFMRIRVRGAMLDELRNMDYLPRLYRKRMRHRDDALVRLRQSLEREPSETELATELGITVPRLRREIRSAPAIFRSTGSRVSLDRDGAEDGDWDAIETLADDGVESPIEAINRQELMEKIRASLQPIEWSVLQLHYLEGMSGREVARKLHLSASRICQIHGRVLSRLKSRLASAG